ncbi:GAP family protein [Nocardia sp. NPDC050697]|uniref:GAP family protein n=1 Tax=Nocardia sp. NPDC050697 TaxID=3155158 RepID=UPI0033C9D544
MGGLLVSLIPELIGLVVTPGAIAGCVLLLLSRRGVRAALAFGAAFVLVYAQVAVTALLAGAGGPAATTQTVAHIAGLVVGVGFLAAAGLLAARRRRPREGEPRWIEELESATVRRAFVAGLALAILNPNLAIMMAGMTIIASSDAGAGAAALGAVALLVAAALDFAVPIAVFLAAGPAARNALERAKDWMLAHDRALSIAVLTGFGVLFTVRGLTALL